MNRVRIFLFLAALVALRFVIGFHFFTEGTDKLKSGNFTAEYFMRAAVGPWQSHYYSVLDDPNGKKRLGVTVSEIDGQTVVDVDPTLTLALWVDFADQAAQYYKFGDPKLIQEITSQAGGAEQATLVKAIQQQLAATEKIYTKHKQELLDWIKANRTDIVAFYATDHRRVGFERDGQNWQQTAEQVNSLYGQRETITRERDQQLRKWKSEVGLLWDSFESQINALAVDRQASKKPLTIHRPFDQPQSKLKWINSIVPWFDIAIGTCLILGLFTRSAALLGAGFLLSVVASQPPWVTGAAPTQYQTIELFALLLIGVSTAGQLAGLDFFISNRKRKVIDQN